MALIRWRKQELRDRFYEPRFRGMYDRFSDVIHDYVRAGDTMLDAGCGSGRVFQYAFDETQKPRLIVGVDMTDEPRGNGNIDAAARADLGRLPFRDGVFDIAISSHVAEHLTEPDLVFRELARVLKPGGRLLIVDMLPHDREEYKQQMGHVWLGFGADQIARLMESAGFEGIRVHALPAAPAAKGPALFAATARRRDSNS